MSVQQQKQKLYITTFLLNNKKMGNGKRIPYSSALKIAKTFVDKDILDINPLEETDPYYKEKLLRYGLFHFFDKDYNSTLEKQQRYKKGKINNIFVKTDIEDKNNPDGRYIEIWYDGYIEDTPEKIQELESGQKYDNVSMGLWPSKINEETKEIIDGIGVQSVLTPISDYGKISKIYGKCSNDEQTCSSKLEESKSIDNSHLLLPEKNNWIYFSLQSRNNDNSNIINPVFASAKELLLSINEDEKNNVNSINIINFASEKTGENIKMSLETPKVLDVGNAKQTLDTNSNSNPAQNNVNQTNNNNNKSDTNPENPLFNKQFFTKEDVEKILAENIERNKQEFEKEFNKKFEERLESHNKKYAFFSELTGNDQKKTQELLKKYGKDNLTFDEVKELSSIFINNKNSQDNNNNSDSNKQVESNQNQTDNNNNTDNNTNNPVGASANLIVEALAQKLGFLPGSNSNNNQSNNKPKYSGNYSYSELLERVSA